MATEAQLKAKIGASTRDWNQDCQALAWNLCSWFGHAPVVYGSAKDAYHASHIDGGDPSKAPAAAFHYWDIGIFGHVAAGLGGSRVLMASSHVDTFWGKNVGVTTVARYTALTGAKYLGWSNTNGMNDFTLVANTPPAFVYWEPTGDLALRVQNALHRRGRYAGLLDGKFGDLTRLGVQRTLIGAGIIGGPANARMGASECKGIQVYAKRFGSYVGPIDLKPYVGSWTGFALGLERP